jgi:hypothetical protein
MSTDSFITKEKELLEEARRLAPGLPFEDVDVLIIDEMGKEDQAHGRTMHTTRSLTFVPVDPVMTASSRVFSNSDAL